MTRSEFDLIRATEARSYSFGNPTDLPTIDPQALISGSQEGVCFTAGAANRVFERYGCEFLDDPDDVHLFDLSEVGPAAYESPPDFLLGLNDATLVGYRTFLSDDGRFISDEVYLQSDVKRRQIERLSRSDEFSNECTGLRPIESGRFRFESGDRSVRRLDGQVAVLLSDEPLSYGSFLFRVLPKVQTLRARGLAGLQCLVHTPSDSCRSLLNLAGIADDKIVQHDLHAITSIERAIVPGMRNPSTYFDPETCSLFGELRDRYGPSKQNARLYISRLGLNADGWSTRIMRNEAELIARLAAMGFEAIEPEKMTMQDQISAFASASIIVGPSGSGMFNTIFCHPGTKIIDLQSEPHWIYSYTGMYASLQLRYGIFVGRAERDDASPVHRPWVVNVDALVARIESFLAS